MGNRIIVKNLPFEATEAQVRALLAEGDRQVHSVKLVTAPDTGRPRGFAFVDMGDEAQAQAAIAACDGKELGGRALKVELAVEKPGSRSGGGHGHSTGFGGGASGYRDQGARGGFGSRGPAHDTKRGSMRGGGRGGGRGS